MNDPIAHVSVLNGGRAQRVCPSLLAIGSDVEIAGRVNRDLCKTYGELIHAEGHFWRSCGTHWEVIPAHEVRLAVHVYDGAYYSTPGGGASRIKLSKSRIDSVLNELAPSVAEPTFFGTNHIGINCASGFIRFAGDGTPSLEAHTRDHRCRHTLPGRWSFGAACLPPEGYSLLVSWAAYFVAMTTPMPRSPCSVRLSARLHSATRRSSSSLVR